MRPTTIDSTGNWIRALTATFLACTALPAVAATAASLRPCHRKRRRDILRVERAGILRVCGEKLPSRGVVRRGRKGRPSGFDAVRRSAGGRLISRRGDSIKRRDVRGDRSLYGRAG